MELRNCDSIEYMKSLPSESIDLIVTDPFIGIGSTGIACVKNNRNFIGCEIDKKYFDIAVDRIKEEENKLRLDI